MRTLRVTAENATSNAHEEVWNVLEELSFVTQTQHGIALRYTVTTASTTVFILTFAAVRDVCHGPSVLSITWISQNLHLICVELLLGLSLPRSSYMSSASLNEKGLVLEVSTYSSVCVHVRNAVYNQVARRL